MVFGLIEFNALKLITVFINQSSDTLFILRRALQEFESDIELLLNVGH